MSWKTRSERPPVVHLAAGIRLRDEARAATRGSSSQRLGGLVEPLSGRGPRRDPRAGSNGRGRHEAPRLRRDP